MDFSSKDFGLERDIRSVISYGNKKILNDIIDSIKPDYLIPWEKSQKLLTEAITWRWLEIAKILLKKGCVIGDTKTLYPQALLCGDVELVKLVLDKDPQCIHNRFEGETLLHLAVRKEIESIVKLLIAHGANVNLADSHGLFPLYYAVRMGNVAILKLLLESGASVESTTLHERESSLTSAIKFSRIFKRKDRENYTAVVKELLNASANVNLRNSFGHTPLHFACSFDYRDTILLLLDAGANVNANDDQGKVPLHYCERNDHCVPQSLIKHFILLKEAGLYLHKENKRIIDLIIGSTDCKNIRTDCSPYSLSRMVRNITEQCQKEIDMMKNGETTNGSVFNILKKLDNFLLYSATEMEIQLLNTVILQNKFPLYTVILKTQLKHAKLRRSNLTQAQDCLASLIDLSESKLSFLPEEIRIHIVSYLETSELDLFIKRLELVRNVR